MNLIKTTYILMLLLLPAYGGKKDFLPYIILLGSMPFLFLFYYFLRKREQKTSDEPIEETPLNRFQQLQTTDIYKKMMRLAAEEKEYRRKRYLIQTHFSFEEQALISELMESTFDDFIKELKEEAPSLSKTELLYSCLHCQLGLENYCCAVCLNLSPNGIRQYKIRIKNKLQITDKGEELITKYFS